MKKIFTFALIIGLLGLGNMAVAQTSVVPIKPTVISGGGTRTGVTINLLFLSKASKAAGGKTDTLILELETKEMDYTTTAENLFVYSIHDTAGSEWDTTGTAYETGSGPQMIIDWAYRAESSGYFGPFYERSTAAGTDGAQWTTDADSINPSATYANRNDITVDGSRNIYIRFRTSPRDTAAYNYADTLSTFEVLILQVEK